MGTWSHLCALFAQRWEASCDTNDTFPDCAYESLVASVLLCSSLFPPSAFAKHHHHHDDSEAGGGQFRLLPAGTFLGAQLLCRSSQRPFQRVQNRRTQRVCASRTVAAGQQRSATACPARPPVRWQSATVDHMLNFMPSRGLIQHEWQKHGTCSGLSAQDYFAKAEQAYTHVQVPEQYRKLNQRAAVSTCRIWKRALPRPTMRQSRLSAFRVMRADLVSLEVCVDKNLQYRSCTQSVRECPVSQVDMQPPR